MSKDGQETGYGRKEARAITAVCLILGLAGIASSISPAIETVLNWVIGLPVAVGVGIGLVLVITQELWGEAMVLWERHRPLRPGEHEEAEHEEAEHDA